MRTVIDSVCVGKAQGEECGSLGGVWKSSRVGWNDELCEYDAERVENAVMIHSSSDLFVSPRCFPPLLGFVGS